MVLDQTIVETSKPNVINAILGGESTKVLCVGFDEDLVDALGEILGELNDPPEVHLLTTESVLKWARDDFVLASKAADLLENGTLSIRSSENPFENRLVVTEGSVVSLITAGEYTAGLPATHEAFTGAVNEKWSIRWDEAEQFSLRTPPRSQVEETLGEEFGSEVEADFRTMLDAIETTRGDERLSGTDVSLLVAAKHELLLYDISRWGEDVGVASKATFSRRKTHLEENALIETETVPIDIGRPRLRLLLGKSELREAASDELPAVAEQLLS
ncbi:transcriptional regulator TbsP [Halococcus sp. IIIV-5B]|uniref:transcriptional regulator TbsP n=1 Tax=Halococcus sp. IIIV-5B TaxID=2321230 RepID=UPI000E71FBC2|nr:DUF5821 family protein [Halococcus sp. IIIV-5B]RJT07582.1 hypothetical protein D3261_03030 [Halococcus sp. IIIV-5B]